MSWEWLTYAYGLHWIFINSILSLLIYHCIFRHWNFFSKQNVKFLRGLPFLGVHYKVVVGFDSLLTSFRKLYEKFPNNRFFGVYELGGAPFYMIRDPELIKQISIKDFEHFINHTNDIHEDSDPLLAKTVFTMKDQKWKDMRSTLSPAFTGSRMRLMFQLTLDVTNHFTNHLDKLVKQGKIIFEMKDTMSALTSDAIASCAFGIESNSIESTDNDFYRCGVSISNFGLKFFGYSTMPSLMNFFKVKIFRAEDTEFFRNIVKENMEFRQKENVRRNDMIDILLEAKKGTLKYVKDDKYDNIGIATVEESTWNESDTKREIKWTDDDLASQCLLFFLAGFTGIALLMSFVCHQLAINRRCQDKLYSEIVNVKERLNGKSIGYDQIQKMEYLDMIISETLRMYPLAPANDRIVTKPYVLEDYDGTRVQLNVGDRVWLPTVGVHMDPQYFPDPDKFDPERFRVENRPANLATVYTPFGVGPRNCIGNRFALMQCKAVIYQLIEKFKLEQCEKTQNPLQLASRTSNVEARNGFWLKITHR